MNINAFEEIGRLYLDLRQLVLENERLRNTIEQMNKPAQVGQATSDAPAPPPGE